VKKDSFCSERESEGNRNNTCKKFFNSNNGASVEEGKVVKMRIGEVLPMNVKRTLLRNNIIHMELCV